MQSIALELIPYMYYFMLVGTFFSCTFEPGDSCFLIQSEMDKFDWTITKVGIF